MVNSHRSTGDRGYGPREDWQLKDLDMQCSFARSVLTASSADESKSVSSRSSNEEYDSECSEPAPHNDSTDEDESVLDACPSLDAGLQADVWGAKNCPPSIHPCDGLEGTVIQPLASPRRVAWDGTSPDEQMRCLALASATVCRQQGIKSQEEQLNHINEIAAEIAGLEHRYATIMIHILALCIYDVSIRCEHQPHMSTGKLRYKESQHNEASVQGTNFAIPKLLLYGNVPVHDVSVRYEHRPQQI